MFFKNDFFKWTHPLRIERTAPMILRFPQNGLNLCSTKRTDGLPGFFGRASDEQKINSDIQEYEKVPFDCGSGGAAVFGGGAERTCHCQDRVRALPSECYHGQLHGDVDDGCRCRGVGGDRSGQRGEFLLQGQTEVLRHARPRAEAYRQDPQGDGWRA